MEIAARVCAELGKPFVPGEYKNGHYICPEKGHRKHAKAFVEAARQEWPHVDDFAKARQSAYDLASGTYVMWADTDDVLLSGAELIREHAERGAYTCFMFPYAIHGKGLAVPRERMMLRGSGKWVCPVHEHYEFNIQPVQAIEDERVVIQHLPRSRRHKFRKFRRRLKTKHRGHFPAQHRPSCLDFLRAARNTFLPRRLLAASPKSKASCQALSQSPRLQTHRNLTHQPIRFGFARPSRHHPSGHATKSRENTR